MSDTRTAVAEARRVVVKVGSSSLTAADGSLAEENLAALVDVVAHMRGRGQEVILVTSGAIAAGLKPLGLDQRPQDLASAQATASVGQGMLIAAYARAFDKHGIRAGQVLLSADDLMRRSHYGNAERALNRLLELGVVPIVNENDTVATDEIRFGDNDRLAALVATVVAADALILLTDVDGLYSASPSDASARLIKHVQTAADLEDIDISHRGHALGTGGMVTKLEAAAIATASGVTVVLTSAAKAAQAVVGAEAGTLFAATGKRATARLQWLAHAAKTTGQLVLDDGAARAVVGGKASLLSAGVTAVRGEFEAEAPVDLVGPDGTLLARGLAKFAAHQIPVMLGLSTKELREQLGEKFARELVHIDDLVVVAKH